MKRKTPHFSLLLSALLAGIIFSFSGSATAGQGDKLIRLSHELEDISGVLRHEFQQHYSHTTAYRHLLGYAARIEAEAAHIHGLAHNPHTSSIHILTDLKELDQVSSQLHNIVDMADIGRYGRVHGDTRHVHEQLGYLTRVIHAMEVEIMMIRRAAPRILPQVLPQTGLLSNVPCDAPNPYLQQQHGQHQQRHGHHSQHPVSPQAGAHPHQNGGGFFSRFGNRGSSHSQQRPIYVPPQQQQPTYVPPQQVAPQNGLRGFSFGGRTFWFRR